MGETKKIKKNILQRDNQKRGKKIQQKHISHCPLKKSNEKSWEGVDAGGKRWTFIFQTKEGKQYQSNGTENLFVVIAYLIEAFKMRLLLIAESAESPKEAIRLSND